MKPQEASRVGPATVGPEDPRYGELLQRNFNKRFVGKPDYVRLVGSTEQVARAVEEAVRDERRVVAWSGGCCLEGFVADPAVRVVIDTSLMTGLAYDPEMRAFVIEAGLTLGEVYRRLFLGWGVTLPAGQSPYIGMGGHVMGGGHSFLSRQHGVAVDHLYAIEVVVVDESGRARSVMVERTCCTEKAHSLGSWEIPARRATETVACGRRDEGLRRAQHDERDAEKKRRKRGSQLALAIQRVDERAGSIKMKKSHISAKAARFTESVIREMTRLAARHQAVNLAQGFPDFPAPSSLKAAAKRALDEDKNQYAITWGAKSFRDAVAVKHEQSTGIAVDPEREITVCCGSTEAMIATLLATVDPGEEVIVFEPWYENYGPDAILSGATPVYVKLHAPDWHYDPAELRGAFSERTKAIIVNTPHNPTGKVFTRPELEEIGGLCREFDTLLLTDEIYEHIVYDGARHVYPMTLPGLRDRTVMISGLSKTFAVTGWRLGYAIAPPDVSAAIRKVHDFLTVGAPAPLQEAAASALALGEEYYATLGREYQRRRDLFLPMLDAAGFRASVPQGAYYVMAEYPDLGIRSDLEFTRYLIEKVGVAVVPASSFSRPGDADAARRVRFCFPKRDETLLEAGRRLQTLRA